MHPIKFKILEYLKNHEHATIEELTKCSKVSYDKTRHHISTLVNVGMLKNDSGTFHIINNSLPYDILNDIINNEVITIEELKSIYKLSNKSFSPLLKHWLDIGEILKVSDNRGITVFYSKSLNVSEYSMSEIITKYKDAKEFHNNLTFKVFFKSCELLKLSDISHLFKEFHKQPLLTTYNPFK